MNRIDVKPNRYRILLEPELESPVFVGTVEIELQAEQPVKEISLNALELEIQRCEFQGNGEWKPCPFSLHADREELRIGLPGEVSGSFSVKICYQGKINEGMAGFYRSRYVSRDREGSLLVTQFEESDARRAFPCFDHPLMKAVFHVEMIVAEDLTAISNSCVEEESPAGAGKKRVVFRETPPMSTYLVFFGVGPFEFSEEREGEILVRAAGIPGTPGNVDFGLEFGRRSLRFCEDYYGIPYPLPKLDLIAVSDFAFGAMENWGAITFRENLLLHYPGVTSRAGEQRICEVIAHEMAHQWFGNLVSPSDWKYLWLNESFATFFGFGVVHHYHADWGVWEQFLHTQKQRAMERDALHRTFPIEIPGGEHVVINEVTSPIIYSKGANILRQIEGYIGSGPFREGLHLYLDRHAYGCASSHHLWEALEEVSRKPVTRLMKSWVEQPGHPLVAARRVGSRLELRQKRFTFLEKDSDQLWLVPVAVTVFLTDGGTRTVSTLLEERSASLDLGPDVVACKVNTGEAGFYRVQYANPEDLLGLGPRIRDRQLGPEDRWGLQEDLFALVQTGAAHLDDYLDLLSFYEEENAYLPLVGIAGNLFHAWLVLEGDRREAVARTTRTILERALARTGYQPLPGETHETSALRDSILFQAASCGFGEAAQFLVETFGFMQKGGLVHPDIVRAAMQAGAAFAEGNTLEWFRKRLRTTESEHDRINVLTALGCFQDKGQIQSALAFLLDEVPDRNKFIPLVRAAANPMASPLLWDWFEDHLERLEKLHPIHFERIIGALVPLAGLDREDRVRTFFGEFMSRKETARDVILMALEKLEINRRMRAS
jgi:aminopeptidase N